MMTDCEVTVLSERRRFSPYGLAGGSSGKKGVNTVTRKGRRTRVAGKLSMRLLDGEILTIESPGGGGWGTKRS
jgi:N-methylhydantoinase B